MGEYKLLIKPKRIIEFLVLFIAAYVIKNIIFSNIMNWNKIVSILGIISILLAIIFIVIEVHSNASIDTGKAILEYDFKSVEEMKSMPSNFWYNRAVTNKSNVLISPEVIAGVGTALISKEITISVFIAVLFWIINFIIRFLLDKKRKGLLQLVGQEGKAETNLAWEGHKYLGFAKIGEKIIRVKIAKESEAVSVGDIIRVIGMEGMKYIVIKIW